MNKITINRNGQALVKINKTTAREVYQSGKTIAIVPGKIRPPWYPVYFTGVNQCENFSFDEISHSFKYYNSYYPGSGDNLAYYIPAVKTEKGYIYDESFKGVRL